MGVRGIVGDGVQMGGAGVGVGESDGGLLKMLGCFVQQVTSDH